MSRSTLILAGVLLIAGSLPAGAQRTPTRVVGARCTTVADTIRGPTPAQIAERQELRGRLVAVGRRNGVTEPQGLLLVDVDSTRRGQLLFLESNFPEPAVQQATRAVAEYLESLPSGRGYQALIRVDGEYPAITPGRQHCTPVLLTMNDERLRMMHEAERRHPEAGKLAAPLRRQALVLLAVSRTGSVALAAIARSSGDEYLDAAAVEIGRRLRFSPATLDGEPFDTRIRFPVGFEVQ